MASFDTDELTTPIADGETGESAPDHGKPVDRLKATGDHAPGSSARGDAAAGSTGPTTPDTHPRLSLAEPSETDIETRDAAMLSASLRALEGQAGAFHKRSEALEQIIRQMQTRIEALQGDQVQALLKPVIQRLAGLHAQAAEAARRAREGAETAEQDFEYFESAIEDALALVGLESVEAAPGVEFDAREHHASRAVPTSDTSLDRRIERVIKQGFTYVDAERVILPAQVSVYRFEASPDVDAPELDNEECLAVDHSKGAHVE